jgi:hypothetical protein
MPWVHAVLTLCLSVAAVTDDADRDEAVRLAREALRSHLGVADTRIHLVAVEPARWNDSSLGCPEKGKSYQPRLILGYGIRLRVEDRAFDVRVAEGRALVCQNASTPPDGPGHAVAATHLYRSARRDLATRLRLQESEVRVVVVRPKVWPDETLGCPAESPAAGTPAPAEGVQGFAIELVARGKTYSYHADTTRAVLCEADRK